MAVDAALGHAQNALALDLEAGLDAALALDALGGIVKQHRGRFVRGLGDLLPDRGERALGRVQAVAEGQVLDAAVAVALAGDAVVVVFGKQHVDQHPARLLELRVEGRDLHPLIDHDQAGGDHAGPAFYFDHAQPAVAGRGYFFVKTQAGNVEAVVPGHLEQVGSPGGLDLLAVDKQGYGFNHAFLHFFQLSNHTCRKSNSRLSLTRCPGSAAIKRPSLSAVFCRRSSRAGTKASVRPLLG